VKQFSISQAMSVGFMNTINNFGLFLFVYFLRAFVGALSLVGLLMALHGHDILSMLFRGLTSRVPSALPAPTMPVMEQFQSLDFLTLGMAVTTISLLVVIDSFFVLGLTKIGLDITDYGTSSIRRLWFANWRMLFNNAILTLLFNIMVFAGTLLFIIPGIVIGTILSFSFIYLVEHDATFIQSLKASVVLTRDARVYLFAFYVLLGVINLIGSIPFGLGVVFTGPLSLCAQVWVYRRLTQQGNHA
jgi:uncharacterized membrane protein